MRSTRGAALTRGMDEFYGRNMPDAPWDETAVRLGRRSSTRRFARIFDEDGVEFFRSGRRLVVGDERRAGDGAPARARVRTTCSTRRRSAERVRDRTVAEIVEAAPAGGAACRSRICRSTRRPGTVAAVRVIASITHTIGGAARRRARARAARGRHAVDGLWAAGVDAGGVATGGYASGLAQALVLGLAAAEDAAALTVYVPTRERAGRACRRAAGRRRSC